MLSGFPHKTKYTPGDNVYGLINFIITPLTVAGWEVLVDNPSGDGTTGRQRVYYYFEEDLFLRIEEAQVFASENAVLGYIKNDRLNRAIESGSGGSGLFQAGFNNAGTPRSFGNWTDFASLDLQHALFSIIDTFVGDGTIKVTHNSNAVVGTGTHFTTQLSVGDEIYGFPASGNVASITDDTHLTLNVNTNFGSLPGTISTTSGNAVLIGSGTAFLNEAIKVGDTINCAGVQGVVSVITDNTHITMSLNSTATASGLSYTASRSGIFYEIFSPALDIELLRESDGEKTLVFDNTDLYLATLPSYMADPADNWAAFREEVRSYDALTTIMPDGDPIGYP